MNQHTAEPLHYRDVLGRPVWMLGALEREYVRYASTALAKTQEADVLPAYMRRLRRVLAQARAQLSARSDSAARRNLAVDLPGAESHLARIEESLSRVRGVAEFWAAGALLSGSAARLRLLEADLEDLQPESDGARAQELERELFALRLDRDGAQRRRRQLSEQLGLSETGLLTKESFLLAASREWERCRSAKEPFGAVVFAFAVRGGSSHPEQIVARLLRYAQVEVARFASAPGDLVSDFGDDAVLFATPGRSVRALAELAERFRRSLEATSFAQGSVVLRVDVAAGVSSLIPSEGVSVERVLAGASDASRASWGLGGRKTVVECEGELSAVEISDEPASAPASAVTAAATSLGDRVRMALARESCA